MKIEINRNIFLKKTLFFCGIEILYIAVLKTIIYSSSSITLIKMLAEIANRG